MELHNIYPTGHHHSSNFTHVFGRGVPQQFILILLLLFVITWELLDQTKQVVYSCFEEFLEIYPVSTDVIIIHPISLYYLSLTSVVLFDVQIGFKFCPKWRVIPCLHFRQLFKKFITNQIPLNHLDTTTSRNLNALLSWVTLVSFLTQMTQTKSPSPYAYQYAPFQQTIFIYRNELWRMLKYNIIQIHNNVLWHRQYSTKHCYGSGKYYVSYKMMGQPCDIFLVFS